MARAILLVAGIAWSAGALAGIGLGLFGTDALLAVLPPLAVDAGAVSRTVLALAGAAGFIGVAHLAVVFGLRADRAWALSAGILLAAGSTILFLALAAAALTSAAAGTLQLLPAVGSALGAVIAATSYALAGAALVHRLRLGGAS